MAINNALFVTAPVLQEYLVDKVTGLPLAAGTITFYKDIDGMTLKSVYQQTGAYGAYTYTALDNPITLSSVGTIVNGSGTQVNPFYYPYDIDNQNTQEAYYIVIKNSAAVTQNTIHNFPFLAPEAVQPVSTAPSMQNLIVNGTFWRNVGSSDITANFTNLTLAPGLHEGFVQNNSSIGTTGGIGPDIQFFQDVADATDTISFPLFTNGTNELIDDITPEYYFNYTCTVAGTELYRYVSFPISLHVKNLESQTAKFSIQTQGGTSSTDNKLFIYLYQYLGSGINTNTPQLVETLNLTTEWTKQTITVTFPAATSPLPTGYPGDDGWFILVGLPIKKVCNVNFTKPSLYLGTVISENDFVDYDQINAVVNSSRTGDAKISLNLFGNTAPYNYGWVPLNDGTIGKTSSGATSRANLDTWPLYSLIWNNTFRSVCPLSTTTTGTAYGDFNAGTTLQLTQHFAKTLLGVQSVSSTKTITVFNANPTNTINVASTSGLNTGDPVYLTSTGNLPGTGGSTSGITSTTGYFLNVTNGTTFQLCPTYADAIGGGGIISFDNTATGTATLHIGVLGASFGEKSHVIITAEVGAHTHTLTYPSSPSAATGIVYNTSTAGNSTTGGGGNLYTSALPTINSTSTAQGHNTIQPSTYLNMFMKL